jgi:hypothetical protein
MIRFGIIGEGVDALTRQRRLRTRQPSRVAPRGEEARPVSC